MSTVNESIVEEAALDWFEALGYARTNGLLIAPGEPASERDAFSDVMLHGRLRNAIRRLDTLVKKGARHARFSKSAPSLPLQLFSPGKARQCWVCVNLANQARLFFKMPNERRRAIE